MHTHPLSWALSCLCFLYSSYLDDSGLSCWHNDSSSCSRGSLSAPLRVIVGHNDDREREVIRVVLSGEIVDDDSNVELGIADSDVDGGVLRDATETET